MIEKEILKRIDKLAYLKTWFPPGATEALEIGPSVAPMLRSTDSLRVRYMESESTEDIRKRAERTGKDPDRVPEISFVYDPAVTLPELVGEESLDMVASSHMIEHSYDLLGHLKEVRDCLKPGGRYLLIVPDKQLCSDICRPPSTLGEAMATHMLGPKAALLASEIDSARYRVFRPNGLGWWNSDFTNELSPKQNWKAQVQQAVEGFENDSSNWSGHNWVFSADSFADLMCDLAEIGELDLGLVDILPTGHMDFIAVLERKHNPIKPIQARQFREAAVQRLAEVNYASGDRRYTKAPNVQSD